MKEERKQTRIVTKHKIDNAKRKCDNCLTNFNHRNFTDHMTKCPG